MHPILFEIGKFEIGSYALFAILGLATLASVFAWLGSREGHAPVPMVELILWAFIVGLASSKLFALLSDYDAAKPWEAIRHSLRYGGHYLVGFFAGATFLLVGFRFVKVSISRGLDYVAPALALGHAVGRVGCYFAGCCWGKACDASWAITFTSERAHRLTGVPLNAALHPTQLYEAGIELVIGALLLWKILKASWRPGSTFLMYVALYGFARFGLEFLRDDPRGTAFGWPTSQPIALATAIGAIAILATWALRGRAPEAPARRHGKT